MHVSGRRTAMALLVVPRSMPTTGASARTTCATAKTIIQNQDEFAGHSRHAHRRRNHLEATGATSPLPWLSHYNAQATQLQRCGRSTCELHAGLEHHQDKQMEVARERTLPHTCLLEGCMARSRAGQGTNGCMPGEASLYPTPSVIYEKRTSSSLLTELRAVIVTPTSFCAGALRRSPGFTGDRFT